MVQHRRADDRIQFLVNPHILEALADELHLLPGQGARFGDLQQVRGDIHGDDLCPGLGEHLGEHTRAAADLHRMLAQFQASRLHDQSRPSLGAEYPRRGAPAPHFFGVSFREQLAVGDLVCASVRYLIIHR